MSSKPSCSLQGGNVVTTKAPCKLQDENVVTTKASCSLHEGNVVTTKAPCKLHEVFMPYKLLITIFLDPKYMKNIAQSKEQVIPFIDLFGIEDMPFSFDPETSSG